MSAVEEKSNDNHNVVHETQLTSNGQTDVSSTNSIANLTINQPTVGLSSTTDTTTTTNYPSAVAASTTTGLTQLSTALPATPTTLPYSAVNPYAAYPLVYPPTVPVSTGLTQLPTALPTVPVPTSLTQLPTALPTVAPPNPYYAAYAQYPYAPYNYYQQPIIAPVLPVTPPVNQKTDKINGEDKSKSKNKNKKAKNQQKKEEIEDEEEDDPTVDSSTKKVKASNVLPFWGNEKTMNLNPLILTNVQNSPYFKNDLYQLKTYHEVVDEIYYQVKHLEPWERGSRKVGGQSGLNCSVRGVGAGGIASTPFCILYKLYTLKLTRKQLNGLLKHKDSPYIRALGFMYVRFTQPPKDFWKWFEPYLEDEEEFEVKAGVTMTIGELCRHMLTKLDWFSTLFPRMPIPVQKDLENQLREYDRKMKKVKTAHLEDGELDDEEYDNRKSSKDHKYISSSSRRSRSRSRSRSRDRSRDRSKDRSKDKSRDRSRDRHNSREDRYDRERKDRDDKHRRSRSRERRRSKERSSYRDRSKERYRYR